MVVQIYHQVHWVSFMSYRCLIGYLKDFYKFNFLFHLELFDAYKIGTEVDMEELQEHLKMAKEIEKKVRNRFYL